MPWSEAEPEWGHKGLKPPYPLGTPLEAKGNEEEERGERRKKKREEEEGAFLGVETGSTTGRDGLNKKILPKFNEASLYA